MHTHKHKGDNIDKYFNRNAIRASQNQPSCIYLKHILWNREKYLKCYLRVLCTIIQNANDWMNEIKIEKKIVNTVWVQTTCPIVSNLIIWVISVSLPFIVRFVFHSIVPIPFQVQSPTKTKKSNNYLCSFKSYSIKIQITAYWDI